MKRYQFRLQQVLRVRRVQADQAAAELGSAQRAESVAILAHEQRRQAAAGRRRPSGEQTGDVLRAARLVWDAELDLLERVTAARDAASQVTAERRDDWLGASRRVKALELLDERRREEHRLLAERAEARRIDDLIARRHPHTTASRSSR